MKKFLKLKFATGFYNLGKLISSYDKTPYFMHQSKYYLSLRFLTKWCYKIEHKILDLK